MLRNRKDIHESNLRGIALGEAATKVEPGRFVTLQNLVPLGLRSLKRKLGSKSTIADLAGTDNVLRLHEFIRSGAADETLAVIARTAASDALYKNVAGTWTLIGALPATGARYTMVTWRSKVFICDGTNAPRIYDGAAISTLTGTNIPTSPQYCHIFQERLILDDGDRVPFSNVLDETIFGATDFHDTGTGQGDNITGFATVSITTSDQGAQAQLLITKNRSIVKISGTLGGGTEILDILSSKIGCPTQEVIQQVPGGIIFTGFREDAGSVFFIDVSGGEPEDIGLDLGNNITDTPDQTGMTSTYFDGFYRLALTPDGGAKNTLEFMLDLRPQKFPRQVDWYGPHSGDEISHYVVSGVTLLASQEGNVETWQLDTTDIHASMTETTRIVSLKSGVVMDFSLHQLIFDAVGFAIGAGVGTQITIQSEVTNLEGESGSSSDVQAVPAGSSLVWDTGLWGDLWAGIRFGQAVVRPRLRGNNIQVTMTHNQATDLEVHGILLKTREIRRQQVGP